ncbi:unnamed protein product [Clavelina lepadiformis]|uniref:BTB domain-containing protein n=2 Tax=Clavelina lepadiformis TaxID=159417 RepID=A0ABP0GYP1_CLALP
MASTTENPNEETIKCVVVGDNNVGKTRLICARAYNDYVRGFAFGTSHVPTVWAIDQYRNNMEVLKNSRCIIDGTAVSLRLWDTFGDHHKNRKFAYGKTDVVVICFSVCDKNSLQQVVKFWRPEVQSHCKNIPVILVSCKVDLRYTDLGKLSRPRGYLSRPIKENDIIFPDQCRAVAEELNCPYYETSVLAGYGVNEVFQNACRAALLHRKSLYFWASSLKHISKPKLQVPLKPPQPPPPVLDFRGTFPLLHNLIAIRQHNKLSDVVIKCEEKRFLAHKVILAAASKVFYALFCAEMDHKAAKKCNMQSIPFMEHQQSTSENVVSALATVNDNEVNRSTGLAAVLKIMTSCGKSDVGVEYSFKISALVFQIFIDFCYTGTIDLKTYGFNNTIPISILTQLVVVSRLFVVPQLMSLLSFFRNDEAPDLSEIQQQFLLKRSDSFKKFLANGEFVDVGFEIGDEIMCAHKLLLASGCDMMKAMFVGSFIESERKEVKFPGTTVSSLKTVFEYIYCNQACILEDYHDVGDLISLANRLCLPNLVSCIEHEVARIFSLREAKYIRSEELRIIAALCEDCIAMLLMSQMHNASRLTEWCLHFLSVHYNEACRFASKHIKNLPSQLRHHLEKRRWPPVWYIKQKDFYDKACEQRKKLDCLKKAR